MMKLEAVATAPQPARSLDPYANTPVRWQRTADPEFPYRAEVERTQWRLRLNDFPTEPLYTLFIENEPIGDLDDFPAAWIR